MTVLVEKAGWRAHLHVGVGAIADESVPTRRFHSGPLRLQKVLYPEGKQVMHAIIVHPPGGVVGGDTLDTQIDIASGAHSLMTTPGAAKWYRSEGLFSKQTIWLNVASGASLEWLPQENIVFDGALTQWNTNVQLSDQASIIGMEVIMLGRKAQAERFTQGRLSNRLSIYRAHSDPTLAASLIFTENWSLDGNDARLNSMQGLASTPCFGQLWAAGSISALRDSIAAIHDDEMLAHAAGGATLIKDQILIARISGDGPEVVRNWLEAVWAKIRQPLLGRVCVRPRIWST